MEHWMGIGLNMDLGKSNSNLNNILELKILGAELMLQFSLHGKRNSKKAYESAKLLNTVNPTKNNEHNEKHLYEVMRVDDACANVHELFKYYEEARTEEYIPELYKTLPDGIKKLPFYIKYYNKYKKPRIWKDNEIAYFADFGKGHFHKWDGRSINKGGVGGSETAVIRLSEEWTKMGYSVVVYGDPEEPLLYNGVLYLPYFHFNQRDKFNVFIQWRHNALAGKISTKKFLVDLHDVTHSASYMDKLDKIDKVMVKSKYHRGLLEDVPDDRFLVISNGI